MAPLIDTIEQAFIAERDQSSWAGGAVRCTLVVEAIELYVKRDLTPYQQGKVEGLVARAFLNSQARWGNDWASQSGDVAEEIMVGLRAFARDVL